MLTMEQPARTMNVEEPQPASTLPWRAACSCLVVEPGLGRRAASSAAASRQERSTGELTRQPVGQRDGTCERAQQPASEQGGREQRRTRARPAQASRAVGGRARRRTRASNASEHGSWQASRADERGSWQASSANERGGARERARRPASEQGGRAWRPANEQCRRARRRRKSDAAPPHRNRRFLPNAEFVVSPFLESREDSISLPGNDFFHFSSLFWLIRLSCQHFA